MIDIYIEREGRESMMERKWFQPINISMITNTFEGEGDSITFVFARDVWTIRILITCFNIKVRIWQLNNIVCMLLQFWIVVYQMKRDFEVNLCLCCNLSPTHLYNF